jgi:hypothetical protein
MPGHASYSARSSPYLGQREVEMLPLQEPQRIEEVALARRVGAYQER